MTSRPVAEPRIAFGSVREPPEEPYPRVLVTRHWPRGIPRGAVDQWEPDLAPSAGLLAQWRSQRVTAAEFAERYRTEVARRPSLLAWVARMAGGTGVALLIDPVEGAHGPLLAELIREHIASTAGA